MNQKSVQPPQQKKRWWAKNVVRIPLICLTIVVVAAGSLYTWLYFSTSSSYLARQAHLEWPAWRSQHEAPRGERRKQCYPRRN